MNKSLTLCFESLSKDDLEVYFESSISDFMSLESSNTRSQYAAKLSANANFIVGRDNKGNIGCLIAYYANIEPLIFITHVHTMEKYKRLGYCSRMLNEICQLYRFSVFTTIKLEVVKTNTKAVSVYTKSGFEIIGETEHKYLMAKYI